MANREVTPPAGVSGAGVTDPTQATAAMIFADGVPAFLGAAGRSERFHFIPPEKVFAAPTYSEFPTLDGANARAAMLAEGGWRMVQPEDGARIARVLDELHADAGLVTYWHFSLDLNAQGFGVDNANPRAQLRAWLVGRDGKVIADDEASVLGDDLIAMHDGHYDARQLVPLYLDPIERCANKLIVDLSNARSKARGD